MTPLIHIVPILRDNYCFVIEGEHSKCIIVDPGEVLPVAAYIDGHDLTPVLILNTHHHPDHVAGNAELKAKYNIPVMGPKKEAQQILNLSSGLEEGDTVFQGGITLKVMDTPGHTKGHICFYCETLEALFCGDTLFSMGCGRLLGGTADELFNSLQKIKSLPLSTNIFCAHEYTLDNGAFALHVDPANQDIVTRLNEVRKLRTNGQPSIPVTLETELKTNPFLKEENRDRFSQLRFQKDKF